MKLRALAFLCCAMAAAPAHATGGLVCRTAGPDRIEVAVGFGHVPGSPMIAQRLIDRGRQIPVVQGQWWLDRNEVRILLVAPNAGNQEVLVRARRSGQHFDGSLWRNGRQRWVRCRDD